MQSQSPHDQITALRKAVMMHDELYYKKAKSEITDLEYDQLKLQLAELEQKYPTLVLA